MRRVYYNTTMRACRLCALLLSLAELVGAQSELVREVVLLARIKQKMKQNLLQVPNYTCLQTIERERREARAKKFHPLDVIRLEVAEVDNKELFAWPGERRFEEKSLSSIASNGAMSNGIFTLHARALFIADVATFNYAGEETIGERRLARYDFRQPDFLSGYRIRVAGLQAIVGWHGSFWADAETFDVFRIRVEADNIPVDLGLAAAITTIDYQRARIGSSDALLPERGEMILSELAGGESRNRTEFTRCRQYSTESAISYAAADQPPPAISPTPVPRVNAEIELPAGVLLSTRLEVPVDSADAAVGDAVRAIVDADVRQNGELLVPKGAVVTGRLRRMERKIVPVPHFILGVEFTDIEFSQRRARITLELQELGRIFGLEQVLTLTHAQGRGSRGTVIETIHADPQPGVGTFFMKGDRFRLPRGLRMVWKTVPL